MARILTFREDNHEYEVDGEIIPSVSEIIRFISREVYGEVTQYILDNAADRGSRVHKATQMLDVVGDVECDEDIVPYVKAYVQFLREHKPEWELIEKSMYHPEKKFAGTLDRLGVLDGKKTIVDIKTSSAVQKVLYGAQLNLYKQMARANGHEVERIAVLHLTKDGKYKLIDFDMDDTVADACVALHNALKKKPRKKKGDTK